MPETPVTTDPCTCRALPSEPHLAGCPAKRCNCVATRRLTEWQVRAGRHVAGCPALAPTLPTDYGDVRLADLLADPKVAEALALVDRALALRRQTIDLTRELRVSVLHEFAKRRASAAEEKRLLDRNRTSD